MSTDSNEQERRFYGELPEIQTSDGKTVRGYPVQIHNPQKVAVVRLPTNTELMIYLAAQRSRYRNLGRRTGEAIPVVTPKADQDLFRAIRLDNGEPWEDAEAAKALNIITQLRVVDCERDGQEYRIKLKTLFGDTEHVVSIPFEQDLAEYQRNVVPSRDLGRGLEERRFPPEVPCKLYDKILVSAIGYTAGATKDTVPPNHKRVVIAELLAALDDLDPVLDTDPNS